MINSLTGILTSLDSDLNAIHEQEKNILAISKKAIIKIRECCKELSMLTLKYEFKNKEEEIYFFKILKSAFYSKLIYYTDIFNIESQKPNGGEKIKKKYIKEHLYKISEHFNVHRSLYQYFRTDQSDWDDRYFTLIKRFENKYDPLGNIVQCDDDYSSTHDMLFAKIMANDLLEVYLIRELEKLNGIKTPEPTIPIEILKSKRKLKWTASKSALTELVYAIVCSKSINDGNVDIKEVMEFVESIFGIDTGDFYRTYVELRLRTKRTKYLDNLVVSLTEKMDNDDEKDKHDPLARK
jgi:hypothetical protein